MICHPREVPWGVVELEPEVAKWIGRLSDAEFGRVEFYIDLLEEKGVHLGEETLHRGSAQGGGQR